MTLSWMYNDLYQIKMLYTYFKLGKHRDLASAEAFYRREPEGHDVVVMAGAYRIEALKRDLQEFVASEDTLAFILRTLQLESSPLEAKGFLDYLRHEIAEDLKDLDIRFVRDGEVLKSDFPVVQVTGPLGVISLLETPILGILNHGVRVATIAYTICRQVSHNTSVVDFSMRRDDPESALHTAVAACIGGFASTSNMMAGMKYGLPVTGTQAHSYILSYGMFEELRAFKDFLQVNPENHALLVDTFYRRRGVANAIRASVETGIPLQAIRLDSGYWEDVIPWTRETLDLFGFESTKIVVSGDFDEKVLQSLPMHVRDMIDTIGIGSRLIRTEPSMGFVYKLVEVNGEPVMKFSAGGKRSLPGRKVWLRKKFGTARANCLVLASGTEGNDVDERPVSAVGHDFPVDIDYIRKARRLTLSRCSEMDVTSWDLEEIEAAAERLRDQD